MNRLKSRFLGLALGTAIMLTGVAGAHADYNHSHHSRPAFNDEYVFATTRGLSDMDGVHPALKLTLFPVTVVLDVAFLPFAVVAGFIS